MDILAYASLVEAILRDQAKVLSVSSLVRDYYGISDICLSLPTVIDRSGVQRQLRLTLNAEEQEGLRKSAAVLKKTADSLELSAPAATR